MGLTGIPNRRQFDDVLAHEWHVAMRTQQPLSLLLMDVDFFKAYNDHYGHGAGDDCLIQVAKILVAAKQRTTDLVARYGGEEFVAILPQTDVAGAESFAQGVLAAVSGLQIPHMLSEIAPIVTISIGVATDRPNTESESKALLAAADDCLYKAKAKGRNCVVSR